MRTQTDEEAAAGAGDEGVGGGQEDIRIPEKGEERDRDFERVVRSATCSRHSNGSRT